MEDLFSTAPDWYELFFTYVCLKIFSLVCSSDLFLLGDPSPWGEGLYKGTASTTALGGLTLNGFLSQVRVNL